MDDLDAFGRVLPLPYRVAVLVVLAAWGWGVNLQYLAARRIDVPALLQYPARSADADAPAHHVSAFRLAGASSALVGSSLVLFWLLAHGDVQRIVALDWLPMLTLLALGILLLLPSITAALPLPLPLALPHTRGGRVLARTSRWLPHDGRRRLASSLCRVVVGGLAEPGHGKFGDVLLADALTSCARGLADLFVVLCMFFAGRTGATAPPDRSCGGPIVVPLILALPFAARLRQCLIEYRRTRTRTHLANATKYATALPVVLFSALFRASRAAGTDTESADGSAAYHRAWMLAACVNSLYSFYWDVAKDWDLSLFDGARARNAPDHAWGLRRTLLLADGQPLAYYAVVALDLLLRCTWSLKLSPHLDHVTDWESSLFVLQLLEVLRRWVWLFVRIETEWVRGLPADAGMVGGLALGGPNPTDILLGDYASKYEDDED